MSEEAEAAKQQIKSRDESRGTFYRLLMSQGRSELNVQNLMSQFDQCKDAQARTDITKKYRTPVKQEQQNKALGGEGDNKQLANQNDKKLANPTADETPSDGPTESSKDDVKAEKKVVVSKDKK